MWKCIRTHCGIRLGELLKAGGLATDLQLLMGHEHIETALIYANVALDRVQKGVARLALVERTEGKKRYRVSIDHKLHWRVVNGIPHADAQLQKSLPCGLCHQS